MSKRCLKGFGVGVSDYEKDENDTCYRKRIMGCKEDENANRSISTDNCYVQSSNCLVVRCSWRRDTVQLLS